MYAFTSSCNALVPEVCEIQKVNMKDKNMIDQLEVNE